jgi:hypothetical protein
MPTRDDHVHRVAAIPSAGAYALPPASPASIRRLDPRSEIPNPHAASRLGAIIGR